MKRVVLAAVAIAATALVWASVVAAQSSASAKAKICHRTSSKTKPYVKLTLKRAALATHLRHAADIYPVPRAGCPRSVLTAATGGTAFDVALTGESESPSGDPVGTGTATIRLRAGQGQLCFSFSVQNVTLPAAGAHIHLGAAGTSGPIVVQLVAPGGAGASAGCTKVSRALVATILRNPGAYYVNVHTTDFAGGAIRGQLTGTSTDTFGKVMAVQLSGANEKPAADPDGTGTAIVRVRRDVGSVCYRLSVQNLKLPAAGAHIHRGAAGTNGPIVVQFAAPDASGVSSGCTTGVATALIDEILANPAGFYVNVHTTEYPGGAIRAQLG